MVSVSMDGMDRICCRCIADEERTGQDRTEGKGCQGGACCCLRVGV